jgi:hypothetical protein
MTGRLLDLFMGLALGGLFSAAGSTVFIGSRLVKIEQQLQFLRRDVDELRKGE